MMDEKLPNYKKVPLAGNIYTPGDPQYKTGDWRIFKPVIDNDKCTKCLLCWIYCPEPSIDRAEDGVEVNYDQCKGCGICAAECPVKCIKMVKG